MTESALDVPDVSPRARALHDRSLVWDAHADTLMRVLVDGSDLEQRGTAQADFPRWKEGGVNVQVLATWADTIYVPAHAARRTLQQIDVLYRILEEHPRRVALARNTAELDAIVASGRLAVLLAIEGGAAIQNDLALLRTFHRLGATSMTLTHSATTGWADSSTDIARWGGLNELGRSVIREMNRLRMLVDVSHVSDDAVRAVLDSSSAAVIASHSSCRAVCDHPRNLPDDLLRAIAVRGGVIGINFFAGFLDHGFWTAYSAAHGDLLARLNTPNALEPDELDEHAAVRQRTFFAEHDVQRPPFERIIEHIYHAVQIAGIDHVGIGADLDSGPIPTPIGLDSFADYPRITEGLLRRGFSDDDVRKILGANFRRVFQEVVG